MLEVKAQPGIEQITLYEGGLSSIDGQSNVVKLSSNENPLGPSDAAIEAFRQTSFDLHRYPSSDHMNLRQAIGSVFDLDPKQHTGAGRNILSRPLAEKRRRASNCHPPR